MDALEPGPIDQSPSALEKEILIHDWCNVRRNQRPEIPHE